MRLMTWNTWWRFGDRWADREARIAAVVADEAPDVLALQETWLTDQDSQPHALARLLGGHAVVVPTPLPPEPEPAAHPDQVGVRTAVGLVSRWPVRGTVVHHLPAERHGPPTAITVTLGHPAGPLHVVVACTEWESDPQALADHLAQTTALAAVLDDPALDGDLPVLLAADLNADVGSEQLAPLLAVATDLWAAGGGDPDAVTLSSEHPDAPLEAVRQIDRRIDHVLARPGRAGGEVRALRAHLAGDRPVDGLHPSDHAAVVVDVVLPGDDGDVPS